MTHELKLFIIFYVTEHVWICKYFFRVYVYRAVKIYIRDNWVTFYGIEKRRIITEDFQRYVFVLYDKHSEMKFTCRLKYYYDSKYQHGRTVLDFWSNPKYYSRIDIRFTYRRLILERYVVETNYLRKSRSIFVGKQTRNNVRSVIKSQTFGLKFIVSFMYFFVFWSYT